ncbi:hypothetical protein T492DRAFT_1043583 [Pavlovales sp. CCMP2436]|nr:hypothetical protein T492DRAFT_1043583 [Pavlovales sp. CCMP2436]
MCAGELHFETSEKQQRPVSTRQSESRRLSCIQRRESKSSLRVRVRQACAALASRDSSTRVRGCGGGDASRAAQPASCACRGRAR